MTSKENYFSLIAGLVGACVGTFHGLAGAAIGAVLAWSIPTFGLKLTENYRLKSRILKTLNSTKAMQVRDLMRTHGLAVPLDCFTYSKTSTFIIELKRYKLALIELENENRIILDTFSSTNYGYVDPPHQWVNDWSGRAYLMVD